MFKHERKSIYSIRKIKSLTASVVIASSFLGAQAVLADSVNSTPSEPTVETKSTETPLVEAVNAAETSVVDEAKPVDTVSENVEVVKQEDPVQDLNIVTNPSFDKDDYVSSSPTTIKHRDEDKSNYFADLDANIVAKSKDNSANDFLLFEVNTEKGKTYTATADVYIDVPEGVTPSGAFFDVKTIAEDGSQTTVPGGIGVDSMSQSVGKWVKQSITFTATGDKTAVGLVKWNDNQNDPSTLNTTIYLDNLKITENKEYKVVWEDDFKGTALNQADWGYELGNIRGNEQEHYSSSKENVFIEDGNLVLKVTDRPEADQYKNTARLGNNARLVKYNSGSVRTHGKREFLYGRIEAKAKLPKGKGAFPAFWTLGADFPIDGRIGGEQGYGWPATGEIDIMELIGSPTKERQEQGEKPHDGNSNRISYGTPHFFYAASDDGDKDGTYAPTRVGGNLTLPEDFYDNYHVFGINWTKDKLEWYVDGVVFRSVEFDKLEPGRREAARLAFNRPQYIQFNLATGGNWAGDAGDNLAKDNTEFKVDWVRWLQSDEQKAQMEEYYKNQPKLEGVKDVTITEGTVADLLKGVTTNSKDHKVDFSVDNEFMFINSGAEGGRNEVKNVVADSADKDKLAKLAPGVYSLYYTAVPTQKDFSAASAPVYRVTRRSAILTVLPKALTANPGATLADVVLPEGFVWVTPSQEVKETGQYKAIFTNPNDKLTKVENRRQVEVNLDVTVAGVSQVTPTEGEKDLTLIKPELILSTEKVPFKTVERLNDSLAQGQRRIVTKGQDGEKLLVKEVYKDGDKVLKSTDLPSLVSKEVVDEVVEVGSMPSVKTKHTDQVVEKTLDNAHVDTPKTEMMSTVSDKKEEQSSLGTMSRVAKNHSENMLPNTGEKEANLFLLGIGALSLGTLGFGKIKREK